MKILNLSESFMEDIRNIIRLNTRCKFREINEKYENFCDIYNGYIRSNSFKRLFNLIKKKYDVVYQKLFLRHALNFLNIYLREQDPPEFEKKKYQKNEI